MYLFASVSACVRVVSISSVLTIVEAGGVGPMGADAISSSGGGALGAASTGRRARESSRSADVAVASSSGSIDGLGQGLERLQEQIKDKMKTIFRTRTLTGCPINLPFCDLDDVMTKVRCCLHASVVSQVESDIVFFIKRSMLWHARSNCMFESVGIASVCMYVYMVDMYVGVVMCIEVMLFSIDTRSFCMYS